MGAPVLRSRKCPLPQRPRESNPLVPRTDLGWSWLGLVVAAAAALIGWWAAGFDQPVYRSLVEHRSPMLTTVMKAVTQAGSPSAMVVLAWWRSVDRLGDHGFNDA